jgi:hypothetical protein
VDPETHTHQKTEFDLMSFPCTEKPSLFRT